MNEIFVIGDTHFGHKNVLQFEKDRRPFFSIEEHDEALVSNWNRVVRKHDTIIHLGDVLFGKKSFEILSRLNGTKKLVLGNHDQYPTVDYLKYFNKVYGSYLYENHILTHVPVHPCEFPRFRFNIHGHRHSLTINDLRYINVSADATGLTPVRLKDVIEKRWVEIETLADFKKED